MRTTMLSTKEAKLKLCWLRRCVESPLISCAEVDFSSWEAVAGVASDKTGQISVVLTLILPPEGVNLQALLNEWSNQISCTEKE